MTEPKAFNAVEIIERPEVLDSIVESIPEPKRYQFLMAVANELLVTFGRTGLITAADRAIATIERAIEARSDDENAVVHFQLLSRAWQMRSMKSRSTEDLDRAIAVEQRLVA